MSEELQQKVRFITVENHQSGQRIDNFLRTFLKGVPKSMIYRILRKGEVRVNKKRIKPEYKLAEGDLVRIPPVRVSAEKPVPSANLDNIKRLETAILYEDKQLIVLNKPSGMAVHGGSGLSYGVIEGLRALRPEAKFLELVHRLDRDTSGCLLIAKKRSVLKHLHEQLRDKVTDKRYYALVRGQWPKKRTKVTAPLQKNTLQSGERMVRVDSDGKTSETRYSVVKTFERASLVEAIPVTGRTHQIRVHSLHAGHPILGDDKYCDSDTNTWAKSKGLNRLFLHAHQISFNEYGSGKRVTYRAPLDDALQQMLDTLEKC